MNKKILLITILFLTSGCLVTRQEVKTGTKSEPLTPEQQKISTNEIRYQETDEQLRHLNGRLEVLENSMNILNADKNGTRVEQVGEKRQLNEKLKIYEDTLSKLEAQNLILTQKVEALQAAMASKSSSAKPASEGSANSFDLAEDEFTKKQWKEAIVGFEKYRSLNPKGKKYSEATFKIGSSFFELGMKTEAKAFYSEVVEKAPKSEWAKKAQARLKTLK